MNDNPVQFDAETVISDVAHRRKSGLGLTYGDSLESIEKESVMTEIYAMQRANGDWFSEEVEGRQHVPLFHSVHDALMSRLRNFGMLLFKPVTIDARLLKQFEAKSGRDSVDFCIIDDPFLSLKHGNLIKRSHLTELMRSPLKD
jgi:hypothetical protein